MLNIKSALMKFKWILPKKKLTTINSLISRHSKRGTPRLNREQNLHFPNLVKVLQKTGTLLISELCSQLPVICPLIGELTAKKNIENIIVVQSCFCTSAWSFYMITIEIIYFRVGIT